MPTFEFLSLCWAEHFVTTCFSTLTYSNILLFVVCCFSGVSFNLKWQLSLSVPIIISTPYCRGKKLLWQIYSLRYIVPTTGYQLVIIRQVGVVLWPWVTWSVQARENSVFLIKYSHDYADSSWHLCGVRHSAHPLLAAGEPSCCHQFLGRLLFLSTSVISATKAVPAVCVEKELFTFWVHLRTYRSAGVIISRCPSL